MRRDVMLLAATCCSLSDRCAARLAHCFKEGHSTGVGAQNRVRFDRRRGASPQYVEFDRPIFGGRWAITQAQSTVLGLWSGDESD